MAVEELENLGFGVGVVEPDGAFVFGVGGVVGQFGCVEGVPARVFRLVRKRQGGGRFGRGLGGRYYCFVPSLEGSRCEGLVGAVVMVVGCEQLVLIVSVIQVSCRRNRAG